MGIHSLPARRWGQIGLVALLGLLFALVTVTAGRADTSVWHKAGATAAKKKCKKKHKSAASAKKKCKKKRAVPPPVATTPPPTPQPLTDSEVIQRIVQKAHEYCVGDLGETGGVCHERSSSVDGFDYGYYSEDMEGNVAACSLKTTYVWSCYGWYETDLDDDDVNDAGCDFREVVERDGVNGIKSHLDTDYDVDGFTDGVDCYSLV